MFSELLVIDEAIATHCDPNIDDVNDVDEINKIDGVTVLVEFSQEIIQYQSLPLSAAFSQAAGSLLFVKACFGVWRITRAAFEGFYFS